MNNQHIKTTWRFAAVSARNTVLGRLLSGRSAKSGCCRGLVVTPCADECTGGANTNGGK